MNKRTSTIILFAFITCTLAATIEQTTSQGSIASVTTHINTYLSKGSIPLIIIGLVYLLFGLKLFKTIIFLCGFVSGFLLTMVIQTAFETTGTTNNPTFINYLIALAVGVACGLIALCWIKVTVFIIGFAAGFTLIYVLLSTYFKLEDETLNTVLAFIGGILIGMVTVWLWEKMIILQTSILGASMIVSGFIHLIFTNPSVELENKAIFIAIIEIILIIIGVIFQNKTKSDKPDNKPVTKETALVDIKVDDKTSSTNTTLNSSRSPAFQKY